MSHEWLLILAAFSAGFFHVLLGPDHYLPFIVMAKARKWSCAKAVVMTTLAGVFHLGISVVLALLAIRFGISVIRLETFESVRGQWAAWGLIAFGLCYLVYGLRLILRETVNQKCEQKPAHYWTWLFFLIFVFGPCEPLIPLFMVPAIRHQSQMAFMMTVVFSATTLMTMVGCVLAAVIGSERLTIFAPCRRYVHAIAGLVILLCGCGVQFLGL